jgi:Protein of unknown function (DUF1592)/Protein of unknown function (DUF1588)/Protein of unknown function (DUF1595)/Protein of unknown function (DUF1585)
MSSTNDSHLRFVRHCGTRAAHQFARALAPFAFAGLVTACGGTEDLADLNLPGSGVVPSTTPSSLGSAPSMGASGTPSAGPGATTPAMPGTTPTLPGTGASSTPSTPSVPSTPVVLSQGGVKVRLLTQAEFAASVQALLGELETDLTTPPDTSVGGFVSVGAGSMTVTDSGATAYEASSLAATNEVFADTQRWQQLVGCQPKADLSDACVATYIKTFGRSAFRRDLTDEEAEQWLGVAKNAAMVAGSAAQGLATATSGLLQSPNFLYRVETNRMDATNGRLKYDGLSMASRLSYALSGGPPSAALLDAAAAGQLDTAEGVRTAAADLLNSPAMVDRMAAFFNEYAQVAQVTQIAKSTTLFPMFTDELKSSMVQGAELFIKNVVLGANSDVRAFFNSNQTYVDANLASLYGVTAPASGFASVTLPETSGRAGIMGQAAVLAGQSQSDRTSPTRRGVFMLHAFLCTAPPIVPEGVDTTVPAPDATRTTRQNLEAHRDDVKCAGCHALFDPMGLAFEHFDPIGRYRDNENGLPIDATGVVNAIAFDGAAELGSIMADDARVTQCMLRNFYRNANGRVDDLADLSQIDSMVTALTARNYVWRDFIADFVASDAFRSAPALPVTTESM